MNRRLGIVSATLALSVTAAFAAVQGDPRQAIETANAELGAGFGRGDARAVAAMYTEGGQLYPQTRRLSRTGRRSGNSGRRR